MAFELYVNIYFITYMRSVAYLLLFGSRAHNIINLSNYLFIFFNQSLNII